MERNFEMTKLVLPEVYLIGYTSLASGLSSYLQDTEQEEFINELNKARIEGLNEGEMLCSFYAKLCYASLVLGKNENISKVRDIKSNILATIESGHGSVFEHCTLNFVITNCSRVFTHELVRHRVGTAFSQTSGRYVRTEDISVVYDDILFPVKKRFIELIQHIEDEYHEMERDLNMDEIKDFATKKRMTSALRRVLPNGQANEIGFSINLRALRHTITMRTSQHAEWEIRYIFNQIYDLIRLKYPAMFADAEIKSVNGLNEITFKNGKL